MGMLKGFLLMCIGSSTDRTTAWPRTPGRSQWPKCIRRARVLQWDHVSFATRESWAHFDD